MKRKTFLLLMVFSSLLLVSCGNDSSKGGGITKDQVVSVITSNADLGISEFTISQNAVHPKSAIDFLLVKSGMIFNVTEKVKAGVDLTQVGKENIELSNDVGCIIVHLPQAKVFSIDIVNSETGLKGSTDTKFFRDEFKTALLADGQQRVSAQIDSLNVLRIVENNTQTYLTALLSEMGFDKSKITIYFENLEDNE